MLLEDKRRDEDEARAGNLSRPLIGPHVLNTDLMVQEETYEALLMVRQRDRDVNWSESQVI